MSLESIVAASVESAREAGTLPPSTEDTSADTATESVESDAADSVVSDTGGDGGDTAASVDTSNTASDTGAAVGAATAERKWPDSFSEDDIKLAQELGLNPPVKDNRMPYTRAVKTALKLVRESRAKDADAVKAREAESATWKAKAENFDRVNQLANNPQAFLSWLASQRPDLYSRYLEAKREGDTTPDAKKTDAQLARDADPEPQPDLTYDDGSKGYSAEGWKKHNEWLIREGRRQASEEFEKRLKPIEQERATLQQRAELKKTVDAQQAKARKRYGTLYDDHIAEVFAAVAKADAEAPIVGYSKSGQPIKRIVPFDDIVYDVLQPLKDAQLAADRNKVREEVLGELQTRKDAAATRKPAVSTKAVDEDTERSTEDVVRAAVSAAKSSGTLR